MSRNTNIVLQEDEGINMNYQLDKGNLLSAGQTSDRTTNQFKQELDDISKTFLKQQANHNSQVIGKGDNDRTSQKSESNPQRDLVLDSISILPAIMIDELLTLPTSEETDKVGTDIAFPYAEKGNWQRPRSKSLEPGAIEDFYPMSMDSSDVFNESGNSSKGFLGFSFNSKFTKFVTTGLTSPNESGMLTISVKTLESSPEEIEQDESENHVEIKPGGVNDFGKNLALLSVQINKSFSGFAKRVPPSAAQSTAGLTLLRSAAVSQGYLVPAVNTDGKKTHSRTTALSAYEINPSHSSSSKIYSLDDFDVIRKVGKGGFARVFLEFFLIILFSLGVLYMKLTIPSTTVKSRFLKTLPVGTIYKDPRNGHSYIIEEKKINECLSKTGVPYIGSDAPIEIQVPDKYMKLDNPKRANIMALMKDKLNQLESLNRELMCKLDVKSRYQQIKELMGDRKYFETERDIFCVGDECVIYQMRITDSKEEAHKLLEKYMRCVWKDPQLIARLMEKQDKIQTKLLQMLSKEIVKESLD